jgi:hypothetical protein
MYTHIHNNNTQQVSESQDVRTKGDGSAEERIQTVLASIFAGESVFGSLSMEITLHTANTHEQKRSEEG